MTTPPSTVKETVRESSAPISPNISAGLRGNYLQNINGQIHSSVGGFYQKYFENKPWLSAAKQIFLAVNPKIVNGLWDDCPKTASRDDFLEWFWKLQSTFFKGRFKYYTSLQQPHSTHQPDLYLGTLQITEHDRSFSWSDVQVIGEFRQGISNDYQQGLLRLCQHASEVFTSQPIRRFLHGVYIRGSIVELWVFDRCGLYSCKPFDFRKKPERLITIMAGYSMMSDEELGINEFLREDSGNKYILFSEGNNASEAGRLYLEPQPIVLPYEMIGRGVTCYRAKKSSSKRWEYVAKFAWQSDEQRQEERFLRLVEERKVWGVIKLLGRQDIESVKNLHQSLELGASRWLLPVTIKQTQTAQSSAKNPDEDLLISGNRDVASTDIGGQGVSEYSVNATATRQTLAGSTKGEPFEGKIFSCVVTYPYGRQLEDFESVVEFLEALCDAIKAHRSLYQVGKILHQDISINNIVIATPETCDDPKGILIDLDGAMELAVGPSKPGTLIGTKPFMAIGLLEGNHHTYRHDLESFLYVLLLMAVCYEPKGLPQKSRLQRWMAGDWDDLARHKINDMSKEHFHEITSEFSPQFKEIKWLAEGIREVLFPIRDGSLFTGTDTEPEKVNKLYDDMVNVFNAAITSHKKSEVKI